MKDEAKTWIVYALENFAVAQLALENYYFNSCLQNAQQAIEKAMKAMVIDIAGSVKRTHQISELRAILLNNSIDTGLTDEECDFTDAIYVPS